MEMARWGSERLVCLKCLVFRQGKRLSLSLGLPGVFRSFQEMHPVCHFGRVARDSRVGKQLHPGPAPQRTGPLGSTIQPSSGRPISSACP
jgi:hypothetical protein